MNTQVDSCTINANANQPVPQVQFGTSLCQQCLDSNGCGIRNIGQTENFTLWMSISIDESHINNFLILNTALRGAIQQDSCNSTPKTVSLQFATMHLIYNTIPFSYNTSNGYVNLCNLIDLRGRTQLSGNTVIRKCQ